MTNPVFIVGLPRSGTTLLAAMLGAHTRIACGPETQFFNKLAPRQRQRATQRRWPDAARQMLESLTLSGQSVPALFGLSSRELHARLAASEPGQAAMLEALTASYAERQGKPRWAEKTPNHLSYAATIRALYPGAKFVRIVRDPRDTAISITEKMSWAPDSVIANAWLCQSRFALSWRFFETDPDTYTLRYEDLIKEPEAALESVCDFIGEDFEPGMLANGDSASEVATSAEPWKKQVAEPLDPSRLAVWKTRLSARERTACDYILWDILTDFGYETDVPPAGTCRVFPSTDQQRIADNAEAIRRLADRGIACAPLTGALSRDPLWRPASDDRGALLLLGPPQRRWSRKRHLLWLMTTYFNLITARFTGRFTMFHPGRHDAQGVGGRLWALLLERPTADVKALVDAYQDR